MKLYRLTCSNYMKNTQKIQLNQGTIHKIGSRYGHFWIIYLTFSKYFRPLQKLVQAADALQTTEHRQQTECRNFRQTDISQIYLKFVPFCLRTFFSKIAKMCTYKFTIYKSQPKHDKMQYLPLNFGLKNLQKNLDGRV